MKSMNRTRRTLLIGALLVAVAPMVPAASASKAGSFTLDDPVSHTAYGAVVPISWSWSPGVKVGSGSSVVLQVSPDNYRWYTIRSWVSIRDGATEWDTRGWPEGTYELRGLVRGSWLRSVVGPIVVDRSAPKVRITRPSEGDVIVEDTVRVYGTVVVGTTTLEADHIDYGTGVQRIAWTLDEEEIGTGSPFTYRFGLEPGRHTLTATATDGAGNSSQHAITLIVGPGPSLVADELPEPPEGPNPGEPTPPDPSTLPNPTPSQPSEPPAPPKTPEPGSLPEPNEPSSPAPPEIPKDTGDQDPPSPPDPDTITTPSPPGS